MKQRYKQRQQEKRGQEPTKGERLTIAHPSPRPKQPIFHSSALSRLASVLPSHRPLVLPRCGSGETLTPPRFSG